MKLFALGLILISLQDFGSLDQTPIRNRQYVAYAAEAQVIPAGRRALLELRFKVQPDFHINSHTPKSDLLIPTQLELQPTDLQLAPPQYPAGQSYSLTIDPTEKLDVYADAFTIKLPVVARAGQHEIKGVLKYQACDRASCYPPRSLPVDILFTAK